MNTPPLSFILLFSGLLWGCSGSTDVVADGDCGDALSGYCGDDCPTFSASDARAAQCGDTDVYLGDDLYGEHLFFDPATGALLAVKVYSDVEEVCGGYSHWYGPAVDCTVTCAYNESLTWDSLDQADITAVCE